MRYAALSLLFAAFAGWLVLHAQAPPAPSSIRQPWAPERAARISHDRATGTFVLTNVSPHVIWYEGVRDGGRIGPHVWRSRTLPSGELLFSTPGDPGTTPRLLSLAPGKRTPLASVDNAGSGSCQVAIVVYCPTRTGGTTGRLIFSDPVGSVPPTKPGP